MNETVAGFLNKTSIYSKITLFLSKYKKEFILPENEEEIFNQYFIDNLNLFKNNIWTNEFIKRHSKYRLIKRPR